MTDAIEPDPTAEPPAAGGGPALESSSVQPALTGPPWFPSPSELTSAPPPTGPMYPPPGARQPYGGYDTRRPRPKRSRLATFFMVAGITASVIAGLFVVAGILFVYSFSNSWGNK